MRDSPATAGTVRHKPLQRHGLGLAHCPHVTINNCGAQLSGETRDLALLSETLSSRSSEPPEFFLRHQTRIAAAPLEFFRQSACCFEGAICLPVILCTVRFSSLTSGASTEAAGGCADLGDCTLRRKPSHLPPCFVASPPSSRRLRRYSCRRHCIDRAATCHGDLFISYAGAGGSRQVGASRARASHRVAAC